MSSEIKAEQLKVALGQKPIDIFQRSSLVDVGRQAQKIILSPGNARMALVCDSNGRVLLIDVRQRVITRMWKGYRDAQCAWLEIFGHENTLVASGPLNLRTKGEQRLVKRSALCAVIYAPKRGILEVWSTQNGMRIAACNVDKEGVLLYCPRANMITPYNHADFFHPIRFMDSNLNIHAFDTVSQTADNKTLVSCTISFERAVEKQSMKSWRDCRYFLDECLKCDWLTYQDSSKVCQFLIEICQQCFSSRRLIAVKTPQIPSDAETSHFYSYCLVVRQIIDLYANVLKNYSQEAEPLDYSSKQFHDSETGSEELTRNLHVEETELHALCDNLQENLLLRDSVRGKASKVDQSSSRQVFKLSKFIKCFDLETSASSASRLVSTDSDNASTLPAYFLQRLTPKQVDDLGKFFFQQFLKQSPDTDFYRNIQSISGVNALSWLELLCDFWLQVRRPYPVHPTMLLKLCRSILSDCKEFKNCLHKAKEKLLNSREMAECLSLCLVLRALAKSYHNSAVDSTDKRGLSSSSVENDEISGDSWEKIDMDVEGWDSLLKIFQARLLTETFIYRLVDACRSKKSKKPSHKWKNPLQTIAQISNLNTVLTGGIGFVVEEISKYIVENCGLINANFIIELFRLRKEFGENEDKFVCSEHFLLSDEQLLNSLFLMKHFYSSPTLDACSLAASCSWQHIRRWNLDPSHFPDSLRSALDFSIQIRDCRTRHGLRTLIWHKFLLERMRSLCTALNKSRFTDGHMRRDRTLGISAAPNVVKITYTLPDDITNLHLDLKRFESQSGVVGFQNINDFSSVMDLDEIERSARESEITFEKDTRWKSGSTEQTFNQHNQTYDDYLLEFFNIFATKSKIVANSLTEVANSQQTCNKRRVALNYQLSIVTFFLVQHHANLSEMSPYSMFEDEEEELFFDNMQKAYVDKDSSGHYRQLSTTKELVDVCLQNKRLNFLKSCFCACIPQSLEHKFSDIKSNDEDWFSSGGNRPLIYRLCQFWQLDTDELRRFEVLVLYAENRAQNATSLAPLITNSHQMAQELCDVVCDSIKSRYSSVNLKTLISPSLRFHLNLDSNGLPTDKQATRRNKDKSKYDPPPITSTDTCEQAAKAAIGFARGNAQLSRLARDLYDLVDTLLTQRSAKK
uniref:Rab3 GTPase-activating protein non-catalytic subunit n=1 Tax=Romanomermis culicivorax TaxID=13658 RepID=A0A915IYW1_ROMCU